MSLVVESWNQIKEIPDCENVAGLLLFQNIFKVEPEAQYAFSFGRDYDIGSKELFEDERFRVHARTVIRMVDTAVQLLEAGKMDTLIAALQQLGARHHKYNIDQHHYPIVGEALMITLETALGDNFTEQVRQEWTSVATLIFETMMTTW